jgi:hypothetical protein
VEKGLLMEPTLVMRLHHAFVPGRDDTAAAAVAEILTRPCFAVLRRVARFAWGGRVTQHATMSTDRVRTLLRDPHCHIVTMDSGRHGLRVASADITTGLTLDEDYWQAYPGPLQPNMIVPHDPDLTQARMDAFCELAVVLRAIEGLVSVEMEYGPAHKLALGGFAPNLERLEQPGMTIRRLRERATYDMKRIDREIPAPEWGLFLGRKHLDALPADAIAATGAFHQVRRLGEDLVFLQLTPDPADALREDFDQLLDRARQVLAPILADPSGVSIE